MRRIKENKRTCLSAGAAIMMSVVLGISPVSGFASMAEETFGYFDEMGNWIEESAADPVEVVGEPAAEENIESFETAQAPLTGTYSAGAGWSVDDGASTSEKTVYKQDGYVGTEGTSTISCSYMDTNYSVLEYEQLRDMLTNNLVYSNVNAQISASAVYTNVKDYLYILIVDDTSVDFRSVYCYVVGDYRCFCVEVKEYRTEAEQLRAQEQKTPQEVGQGMAESFVWN
ncbi:MAG: hypothetical protein Q4C61_11710 [Lachnospiraceae bacterium]|nr:hypothetical protein [Lachnospiraceae bacterium]